MGNALWIATLAIGAAVCMTPPGVRAMRSAARGVVRLARHRLAMLALIGSCSLALGALPTLLTSPPLPAVHDEFSYLLAADTFRHGRLANPSPRQREHFETFHEIVQPTYASKFPPGQGLALALGWAIWHPILGAWLATAAACAAVAWMLLAFFPPRWALLGAAVAVFHPAVHLWGQNYWGGAVAMLGGALLGGAAGRALCRPVARYGIIAAAGIGILAISRPFEGAIVTMIVAGLMLISAGSFGRRSAIILRVGAAALIALVPVAAWMGYYNWRVTGSPLQMPYAVHARQYMVAPLFFWQTPADPPPVYHDDALREFYTRIEHGEYLEQTSLRGFIEHARQKLFMLGRAYINSPALWLPLLVGVSICARSRAGRWGGSVCILLLLSHLASTPWMRIQYMAPAMPFLLLAVTAGLRRLARWRMARHPVGAAIVAGLLFSQAAWTAGWAVEWARRPPHPNAAGRQRLFELLGRIPGKHLVLVRYSAEHNPLEEWVFNSADLEGSPILLARARGADPDRRLAESYPDRSLWLLEPDEAMRLTALAPPRVPVR